MAARALQKLVIVDDDDDILTIAKYALKSLKQLDIKFLHSGKEAIQEIPKFAPDLILLDMMMPEMDGLTTLKALRDIPSTAHIPVILFTAKSVQQEMETYRKLGVFDVIVKPFDPINFAANVQALWERCQTTA